MVVRHIAPTRIWFNIKYKIFRTVAVDIDNGYASVTSSFGGRPIGSIEAVEFEKVTDDFYWFTLTSGRHMGLHIGDIIETNVEQEQAYYI